MDLWMVREVEKKPALLVNWACTALTALFAELITSFIKTLKS
jgi:hypothetical protein